MINYEFKIGKFIVHDRSSFLTKNKTFGLPGISSHLASNSAAFPQIPWFRSIDRSAPFSFKCPNNQKAIEWAAKRRSRRNHGAGKLFPESKPPKVTIWQESESGKWLYYVRSLIQSSICIKRRFHEMKRGNFPQVLQPGVWRRKDPDPAPESEALQVSHLPQEALHGPGTLDPLHAGPQGDDR